MLFFPGFQFPGLLAADPPRHLRPPQIRQPGDVTQDPISSRTGPPRQLSGRRTVAKTEPECPEPEWPDPDSPEPASISVAVPPSRHTGLCSCHLPKKSEGPDPELGGVWPRPLSGFRSSEENGETGFGVSEG